MPTACPCPKVAGEGWWCGGRGEFKLCRFGRESIKGSERGKYTVTWLLCISGHTNSLPSPEAPVAAAARLATCKEQGESINP